MRELRRRSRLLAPSRVVAPPAHGARIGVLSKRLNPTVNSRAAVTLSSSVLSFDFPPVTGKNQQRLKGTS
jgi:hypothetical protein